VAVRGNPVRDSVTRETVWKLFFEVGGTHELTVYAKGSSYTFPLTAEKSYRMIGFERKASGILEPIIHPGLPPVPPDSPFQRIAIDYPRATHPLLGWQVHWIVIFLVYSMIAATALKFLIGIEI
jgi:hypothetical protein